MIMTNLGEIEGLNVIDPVFIKDLISYAPAPYWFDRKVLDKAKGLHAAGITLRLWNIYITTDLGPGVLRETTNRDDVIWGSVDMDLVAQVFDRIETEFELALRGQRFTASTVVVSVALRRTSSHLREASLLLDLVCLLIGSAEARIRKSTELDLDEEERDSFFARANAAVFEGWNDE
jgi:hypothetical protein